MISNFIERFDLIFKSHSHLKPWELTTNLADILQRILKNLSEDFFINDGVAIHKTAVVEQNVVLKPPVVITQNCFIGANAYLRGPIYLDDSVKIGAGCEIKQSVIFSHSAIAHFNYIGNSVIGSHVNFEAGSIAANHFNERADKNISILIEKEIISTSTEKFGSLVGDYCRIGANAVLSPGTLLQPHSVVNRLQLIDQLNSSSFSNP